MSNSRKQNRHFLDDRSIRQGKQNDKDLNRGRKFNWRGNITDLEEQEDDINIQNFMDGPEKKTV